jgi:ribosome maturation factor RimP
MGMEVLEALVAPAVEAEGYRLVRLRLLGSKRKTLQIMAERADGTMDVEDCARLSRLVSEILDEKDPIEEDYDLEVSSPGIDRPLTAIADYARFAGHLARFELVEPLAGRKRFRGLVMGADGRNVVVEIQGKDGAERIVLPFNDIHEAKLVLTDRLIEESQKARDLKPKD